MPYLSLKPNHKAVQSYYQEIKQKQQLSFLHEGAVAPHFAKLLQLSITTSSPWPASRPQRLPTNWAIDSPCC